MKPYHLLRFLIAMIWIANGLFCKILNLVPRHEMIVARILGTSHARLLTVLIGVSEVAMAVWILSGYKSKLNALAQTGMIVVMNTIEYFTAPDLLLWGKANALFAILLIAVIGFNEFILNRKSISFT